MVSLDFISSGMGSSGGFVELGRGLKIPMATERMGCNGTREMQGD